MNRINVLPKSIAELIAAGEVVERPASVVKELVENSIDAGATMINVEIRNGGVTYIRVTDNGCGICYEDVPKAFISHATSKILTENDLNSLMTLGFRGEALASVAAVAKVEMYTKTFNEAEGTNLVISGGEQKRYSTAGCPNGTTVVVRDLFFNTPARMKFLKKDVTEANAAADIIDKLALSHPEISFRFIRDNKQTLLTPGDGKLLSAIYAVFGKQFAESLIKIDYELERIKVSGYVCKPVCSRASRVMQIFFLNNRYIKSRSCVASLENAYRNSIMVGKFPACVLNIKAAPDTVDVNVHPTKTEVRFSDEKKIYNAIYYAVQSALNNNDTTPELDLSKIINKRQDKSVQMQMEQFDTNTAFAQEKPEPKPDFWGNISDFRAKREAYVASPKAVNPIIIENEEPDLLASFNKVFSKKIQHVNVDNQQQTNIYPIDKNDITDKSVKHVNDFTLIGEAFKTYIILQTDSAIYLIDKHAAHERIIFNDLKSRFVQKSQVLISPIPVTLSKNEYSVIIENKDLYKDSGFLVEDFGAGTIIIRECPMIIDPSEAQDTVIEIANNLMLNKPDSRSDRIDSLLHTIACKAAIKAGNNTTQSELAHLAFQVLSDDKVRYCPHGRPVLIELTRHELEKQFGRIQ